LIWNKIIDKSVIIPQRRLLCTGYGEETGILPLMVIEEGKGRKKQQGGEME
jgi:hypothetical protein